MDLQRKCHKVDLQTDSYGSRSERVECSEAEATVISSRLRTIEDLHAPALDLDLPCRLLPSKTPGHFHLYIDVPMPWKRYRKLMKAMVKAQLVEEGFYKASVHHKASDLRVPEVVAAPPTGVWYTRAMAAETRCRELEAQIADLHNLIEAITAERSGPQSA